MADSIDRQAAVDLVTDMEFMNDTAKGILRDRLRKLQSAQPERKQVEIEYTEWNEEIWGASAICGNCGCTWQIANNGEDNFCPNCGTQMIREEEEKQSEKDLVSRKEATRHLKKRLMETAINNVGIKENADYIYSEMAENRIDIWMDELPAIQPERKKGAWIEYIPEHGKCPFCGNQVDLLDGRANNFCCECGADMREGGQCENN